MTIKAVMKKDETRVFFIIGFDGESVKMYEDGNQDSIKEMKRKSFVKGYKMIEGTLDDAMELAPAPVADQSVVMPSSIIASIDINKPAHVVYAIATVVLTDPDKGIDGIAEDLFISELVNHWGVTHGDKVVTDSGMLGYVDLIGNGPKFGMLPPRPIKDEDGDREGDTITFTYAESGIKVTMTRQEFYSMTHSVTMKDSKKTVEQSGGIDIPSDKLPDFEGQQERPGGLSWAMQVEPPNYQNIEPCNLGSTPTVATDQPQAWNLQPPEHHAENSMRANRAAKLEDAKPFMPEPFFLRQSMISSYEQCPDKMYDTYENGYHEESIFTRVGTAIHGIMEDFYNDRTINIPETFDKWWAQHAVPEWDWYRDWRSMVDRYFQKEAKYEAPNVIVTELEYQTTINGVPVSGTIDRVDRIDERTIRIVDYKTNFRAWTEAELQESVQFMMYTSAVKTDAVRQLLRDRGDSGEFEVVVCTYEMLRLGYRQTAIFGTEELVLFADWMKTIWTMILSGTNRRPKLNQYCGYCQKRHKCELYQEILNAPIQPIVTENTDIDGIVEERDKLAVLAKVLKGRLDEIDAQIKAKIAENEGLLVVGEYEWSTKAGTTKTYPAQDVFRILAMNGLGSLIPDLVSISNTRLQEALKGNKDVLEKIDGVMKVGYKQPSLNKKKIKPVKNNK